MYKYPSQAEPYLPPLVLGPLLDRATQVVKQAGQLVATITPDLKAALFAEALEASATATNALEGEERDEHLAAHFDAERSLDALGYIGAPALGSTVLKTIHHQLFSRVDDGSFEPGVFRGQNVKVQRHVPPHHDSLSAFLARTDEVYLHPWKSPAELLLAVAAAHHRMTWIHPFRDGNGRSIRLQSSLALRPLGSQFWSLSAGLWRRRDDYFRALADADSHRLGDLDGRGNLSLKRLVEWTEFVITVAEEQVQAVINRVATARLQLKIFDPANAHLFSREAALEAFRHVIPRER